MENNNNEGNKSRRQFLSAFFSQKEKNKKPEMVKMLTADGKLVEVEKSIYEAATNKQKANNKTILDWMDNPSKQIK